MESQDQRSELAAFYSASDLHFFLTKWWAGGAQGVGSGWGAENKSGGLKNEEIWVGLGARTVIGIKPRELLQGLPGV